MKHESQMNQEEPSSSKRQERGSNQTVSQAQKITLSEKIDGFH